MHSEYFQAIIQLRNPNAEANEYIANALKNEISKVKKVRNGLDFYVKDKKKAERTARNMIGIFGGEFKVAPRLHTRDKQSGKELYRLSILVRLPAFCKKDIIKTGGKIIKVTGLGKKVSGLDLQTGKKISLNYPEDFEILEKFETSVVKLDPEVEVLNPETYQSETLQNLPGKHLAIGEKVEVVVHSGLYIV